MKTSSLSLGSALLLAACFSPTGSGDPTGAAETAGPGGEPTSATGESSATTETTTVATVGTSDAPPTTGPTVTSDASTGTVSTSGEPRTEDDCECTSNSDCEPPLTCEKGQCVGCLDDSSCDGGVCDPVDHVCRKCIEHSECSEGACELDDGVCFPPGLTTRAYVDPNEACAEQPCTPDLPCCSIGEALVNNIGSEYLVVQLAPGIYPSVVNLPEDGRKVALLGNLDTVFTVDSGGNAVVQLGVGGVDTQIDSELYVAGVVVSGGQGDSAFRCSSAATLWLDDVQILGYGGRALASSRCDVTLRRSVLRWNTTSIVADTTSVLALENVMLAHTGTGAALEVGGSSTMRLLYTTIADSSKHAFGLLACNDTNSLFTVRNSVLVSDLVGETVSCSATQYDVADSVVSTEQLGINGDQLLVLDPSAVPSQFVNWADANLHVVPGGAFTDRAIWKSTHPRTDIDGDPRPTVDGTVDVAGADRPAG
ncbi:hypothetical protein [Nannocystis radixulma]|uniref:Uncharacterized protein n=1 Tax=Nannocystis radixulma TaxID=2995305 RepID=A0ABT5BLY3_9BACT|nr:hypothetical protein [Nannocystis radixulma]MDC0675161.1 hypothetical protein [Nannocystis radixulma]